MNTTVTIIWCICAIFTIIHHAVNTTVTIIWCISVIVTIIHHGMNMTVTIIWCICAIFTIIHQAMNTTVTIIWCISVIVTIIHHSMNTTVTIIWCICAIFTMVWTPLSLIFNVLVISLEAKGSIYILKTVTSETRLPPSWRCVLHCFRWTGVTTSTVYLQWLIMTYQWRKSSSCSHRSTSWNSIRWSQTW